MKRTLKESGEMYLETILILTKSNGNVRSIDIALHMGYSKPSVSRAVAMLKENDFISVEKGGLIKLTKQGKELAEKIYERHITLSKVFEKMGVSPEIAEKDACRIEHYISDETFKAITKYAGI